MATLPIDIEKQQPQEWLRPAEESIQNAVRKAFSTFGEKGRAVADILHGTWLGHPLHPALTDVPVGAWTAALVFDLIEEFGRGRNLRAAADGAVAIGLVGAAGSAITGIADWKETDPPARGVGLLHGLLNITATSLYVASLFARRGKARPIGRLLSYCGYAIAGISAYLGGSLAFTHKIGVDHAPDGGPEQFTAVGAESGLAEGQMKRVMAGDVPVLLARYQGRVFAIAETCSHLGGPLSEGKFENGAVTCPWHSSTFNVTDGGIVHGPATHPQPCFEVRLRNGQIEVRRHH